MTLAILLTVWGLFTILLIFRPVSLENLRCLRRVRALRVQHRLLDEAHGAGTLGAAEYAAQHAALRESTLDFLHAQPARIRPTPAIWICALVLVPLASSAAYQWLSSPRTPPSRDSAGDAAAMPDHGTDMQTVIGNLAAKLREHPDDAEGWALLGRTYKATEHYTEARDAFRHALEAAPGDAALEREYAAMAVAPAADNAVATRGLLPVR